jgi:Rrf2 family transcriptional regulator, iron-sulfur cluster assembly transcription factor
MSILFSRQCEYALQAVSFLALQPSGKLTSIKELARKLNIPYHFLGKILQHLAQKNILASRKGNDGGFAVVKSGRKLTLYDIIESIDGDNFKRCCVMGFPVCSSEHPCSIHFQWEKSRNEVIDLLSEKDIYEMAELICKPEYKHGQKQNKEVSNA